MSIAALANIRIVLVRTFHPGNIGSATRSMKTMGLDNLCLVEPKDFPSEQANQMAAGAEDLLVKAHVFDNLTEVLNPCSVVIASTARPRSYDLPELSPEQAAAMLLKAAKSNPVALLFGPERMGLHNKDLALAKYRVTIPANPEYSSLNMAAAVQTLCYEIYKQATQGATSPSMATDANITELATVKDIELLHEHLEQVLTKISFLRPHQGETLLRIRHFVRRAQLDKLELNIVRGILTAIEKTIAS